MTNGRPTLKILNSGGGNSIGNGGGPPHDADMEKRLAELEALIPTLATKADVEKASHDVTKWLVGTMVGGIGLFIVIMTFVLNNAVPRAPNSAPASAPVIIQIPSPLQAMPTTQPPQPETSQP